ncbi:right-handed parallel beta-helix repeat-containing protein [Peptoniphilus vaginalis]|uniref:right-handed parallel beta-helix repeat-containing protein n=1 Tax=Peptoniphilus vaginalis TaxID=1756987 RepID=UPI0023F64E8A|nr:right-handed parallel beta-helix repeat-containing protein [Peptoniphilus vaginalis]
MTNLNKMYDGVANSPDTFLTSPLASGGNIMYVADSSVFGTLPNLAVLGSGANAETVLITSKRSDQGLNIQRAVEGVARDWVKASIVARNFTNYDYQQIKDNIEKLNKSKQETLTAGNNIQIVNGRISATDSEYDDTQIKEDIAELQNSQLSKASQTEAESGVDNTKYMTPQATKQAIEKLSPKQDLSGYALKKDIKTKLSEMTEDSTHRTVTDTEKQSWNKKFDLPVGKENQVLTKTTNGAEFKEISSSRSATFVIANYDSSENSKAGADYVIRENESPCDVINSFIEKLPSYGGKIQLTEGHFIEKKDKSINLNKDNITLSGYGESTNLERTIEDAKLEFIKIFNSNIILENLQINTKSETVVWVLESATKCELFNISGTSIASNVFLIEGSENSLVGCIGENNSKNYTACFHIEGSNNLLSNCLGTSTASSAYCINGSKASLSNCSGTSIDGSVFAIFTDNNQLSNCSGTSIDNSAFFISDGSNNKLSNCSGTSTNTPTFWINGSNNSFSNCSGTSSNEAGWGIKGSNNLLSNCLGTSTASSAFWINGSNNSFSNCSGTSTNDSAFFIKDGPNNLLSNCLGTSTNNIPFNISGVGNVLTSCIINKNSSSKFGQIWLQPSANNNIITSCVIWKNNILNQGTNNIIANNIKLEV